MDLYDAALRASSRNTYRTGQRAYDRFMIRLSSGRYFPFEPQLLTETELNLAFFMAFLLLEPRIRAAGTILGYETHVKFKFKEEGCPEELYTTQFLKQVRRGVKNTLPSKLDMRGALLLPLLTQARSFRAGASVGEHLLHFSTIIGFIGMLRPHTFAQLRPNSFTLVTYTGRCIKMPNNKNRFKEALTETRARGGILGFYINFQSKTMANAQSYLPSLCSRTHNTLLTVMCPVKALINITSRGLVAGHFLKKSTTRVKLSTYLKTIAGSNTTVAPYALRIGGRTWKISHGMDRQMVDFLGTWKSPDASARYFRGNPRVVLLMVRKFYLSSDPTREERQESQGVARGS